MGWPARRCRKKNRPPDRWINAFKDTGLCGAVFVFAGTQSAAWKTTGRDIILTIGRTILGISITGFGVMHLLYPKYAPGIPPMVTDNLFPVPGKLFWGYLTGVLLLASGVTIVAGKGTRLMVAWLGIITLLFALLLWVPCFGANPGEVTGSWLKDMGVIGGLFILADSMPKKLFAPL